MIKFNIATKGVGELREVSVEGEVKGSGDVVAMEILAMLDELEEICPLALMTAIYKKVHDHDND